MIRAIALVLGAVLLSGCGAAPNSSGTGSDLNSEVSNSSAPEPPVVDPTAVGIPKLGAWSTLIPLGLTDVDCPDEPPCLDTPPVTAPMQAGWYAGQDPEFPGDEWQPGEPGPAVIAGHVDGVVDGRKGQPGIFLRLHELVPGDQIIVERNHPETPQSPLTFVVTSVQRYPKAAFPTEQVYGESGRPVLHLITCGGEFDRESGHYIDNVVVGAELA